MVSTKFKASIKTGLGIMLSFLILIISMAGMAAASSQTTSGSTGTDTAKVLAASAKADYAPGQIIIKFKKGKANSIIHKLAGTTLIRILRDKDTQLVKTNRNLDIWLTIGFYRMNPQVLYAEPNYRITAASTPNDPRAGEQWALNKLQLPQAWNIRQGKSTVKIAILDTGVDMDHEDLAPNIGEGVDLIDPGTPPNDENGHGTHVAGIAAAIINNNLGVAGVAGGVKIMPVRVLDEYGGGYIDAVLDGIRWAADHGARVINMSYGSDSYSFSEQAAVNYAYSKGVVVVAAAGNSHTSVYYPAAYNHVIAVSATDSGDIPASFTNFGDKIDVAAPGVNILSATPNHTVTEALTRNYGYISGTSMASPFVAGLAALVISQNPLLNPDEVEKRIEDTADDLGTSGFDKYYGYGRINALKALTITDAYEPNNTMGTAAAGKMGASQIGILNSSLDTDWYKFNLTSTRIRLSLAVPSGIDGDLTIFDSTGKLVKEFNNSGTGVDETGIIEVPAAGVYYVKVSGIGGSASSAPYNLLVSYCEKYESNDSFAEAALIPVRTPVLAKINPFGDQDYYVVNVPLNGTAKITLTSPAQMDGMLYLYDAHKNILAYSDYGAEGESEVINKKLTAGTYYVKVMDMNNSYYDADYSLKFDMIAPEVTSSTPASNTTGFGVDRAIKINFSGTIYPGTTFGKITLSRGNTLISGIKTTISGSTLIIKSNYDLACASGYTVRIPAGAVIDANGNAFWKNYNLSFTTAKTPPVILDRQLYNYSTNQKYLSISGTIETGRNVLINGTGPNSLINNHFTKTVTLVAGVNYITITSADRLGNTSKTIYRVLLDNQRPIITSFYAPSFSTLKSAGTTFRVAWLAKDPSPASGLNSYDIQVKTGAKGLWTNWKIGYKGSFADYVGVRGKTYYFRARARDKASNTGSWTTGTFKTVVPFDDTSLVLGRKGFAAEAHETPAYGGTLKVSHRGGDEITYRIYGKKVSMLAYRGPSSSKARIYIDGKYKATIDTYVSRGAYRNNVYSYGWTKPGRHSIRIINMGTRGRANLKIDGLAVEN